MKTMLRQRCARFLRFLFRHLPLLRRTAIEIASHFPAGKVRGHAHYRKGHIHCAKGRPLQAISCFSEAIEHLPGRPDPYFYRGKARLQLEDFNAAEADFRIACTLSPLAQQELQFDLLICRASALVQLNRLDEASKYYIQATRLKHRAAFQEFAKQVPDSVPTTIDALERIGEIDALDSLAEDVINRFGRFDQAFEIYQRKWQLQEQLSREQQLDKLGLLVLSEDWVRNVGHIGFIDFIVKMQKLGWRPWKHIILLAPPHRTANRCFAQFWSRHMSVVTDPFLIDRLAPLAIATGNRVAGAMRTPDGAVRYFLDSIGTIQSHWERAGNGPLLDLSENQRQRGRQVLKQLGVPSDAWFVCVHVRESGFHKAGDPQHQAHRDADIESYIPAFREITSRGGWVIRMGDSSMKRLPPVERVIDYAHTSAKSEWMDVFLSAECRFFIGVASGLSHVAFSFGRPCVYTNWISNVLPAYAGRDLFVPKLLRRTCGRLLSLDEMLNFEIRRKCYGNLLLQDAKIGIVDSTPADLRDAVLEMMDRLDGRFVESPEDAERQRQFHRIATSHSLFDFCRIGSAFLRKHPELLASDATFRESAGKAA